MTAALVAPLFFTVALLVTHGYFLLGSVPLLILKHDVPMDARFVRGFYGTYYLANEAPAIAAFRRIHVVSILLNVVQLVLIVWGLIAFSMQLRQAPSL